jgi:hypothetical protein
MAGTVQYASHANFFTGMVRDIPRHLIPDGAVYDATNIVITNSGSLAKRGASTTALASGTTMSPVEVASQRSANVDGRSYLYPAALSGGYAQFGNMAFSSTAQPLYTYTTGISADGLNAPTTYGDSAVFPISTGSSISPFAWCGGANFSESSATYSGTVSVSTVSGNSLLNIGSTAVSNVFVGGFIHLSNGGTNEYTGRVVRKDSATEITVDPAPIRGTAASPISYTSLAYYPVLPIVGNKSDGQYIASAGCIGTFTSGGDSRIVLGNVRIVDALSGKSSQYPNRIVWSVREAFDATPASYYSATPGSAGVASAGGTVDGLVQATRMGFPKLNYIDIEDIEQIIGLVPVGSGNMLVLGTKNCVLLSGTLTTQADTVDNTSLGRGGLTAGIRAFSQQVGCISAKSVQRTTAGVMFAASDGVYLTDGASLVNTMTKKISNMWGDSLAGTSLFTFDRSVFDGSDVFAPTGSSNGVYGSANINDTHYYISMASGGFLCDLRAQFGWTRVQAGQLDIAGATSDSDQTTNRIYAIKYNGNAATSSTDRIIRLDPVVTPAQTTTDADGQTIDCRIITRAYAEGDPAQKRRYRHTMLTYELIGGSSLYPSSTTYPSSTLYPGSSNGYFNVTATKGLDGAGSSALIGTTSATATTSTVDRYDHQSLTQALTYTIETSSSPPAFALYEVTNGFNQLRPGRVS